MLKKTVLIDSFERSGVGLHSGRITNVKVGPADKVGMGRYFVRVDIPEAPIIPARVESVKHTMLSTELGVNLDSGEIIKIRTVEHLLSSLMGMGIDDAKIEVDGSELPLLDGSAQDWVTGIKSVSGLMELESEVRSVFIKEPISIQEKDIFVAAIPASTMRFSYGIDFDYSVIGNQWYSWSGDLGDFSTEIAPARTFGLAEQIAQLQDQGLIKGGSLDNALVCSKTGWVNPPLRFDNEPVRHKLLDLIGDLSLLGVIPIAHYIAYKASHCFHVQLAQKIQNLIQ